MCICADVPTACYNLLTVQRIFMFILQWHGNSLFKLIRNALGVFFSPEFFFILFLYTLQFFLIYYLFASSDSVRNDGFSVAESAARSSG